MRRRRVAAMADVTPLRLPYLMSEQQAAGALGVSVDTLQRLRKRRAIRHRRIGGRIRYTEADLALYIADQTVEPCATADTGPERSEASGSAGDPIAPPGAGPGSISEADRHVEYLSAKTILSAPSSRSRPG